MVLCVCKVIPLNHVKKWGSVVQDEKTMKITFWRPSRWDRRVFDKEENELAKQSRFLEEVHAWEPAESIWGSIEEEDIRVQLIESIMDAFSPDKPPEERGIECLQSALEQIAELITKHKSSVGMLQADRDVDGGNISLRADLLLLFFHNLTWLYDVFKDMPEISVMIR